MDALLHNFFNLKIYGEVFPYLLQGLWTTVWLSLLIVPLGIVAGLALALLGGRLERWWSRLPFILFIDFFRSFPPLVLLIFIFFGSPFFGLASRRWRRW